MKLRSLFSTALILLLAPASALAADPAAKAPVPAKAEPAPLTPPSPPVALYLTWQRDPATTMTVHWHTDWKAGFADSVLEYRPAGNSSGAQWQQSAFPLSRVGIPVPRRGTGHH